MAQETEDRRWRQVRSVVAALTGDWTDARAVQLDLPETGVSNSSPADSAGGDNCCEPQPAPRLLPLASAGAGDTRTC